MTPRLWGCALALATLTVAACHPTVKPGDPLPGLSREQRAQFDLAAKVFDTVFTPETGLGPVFNSTSCAECHEDPVRGGTGDEKELHATAFRAPVCDPLVDEGGFVIQLAVTPALKAALGIDSEPFPPSATARAMRTTPVVFGRGLLDLVPDSAILAYADPDDRDHDGISGRVNRFVDGRVGRFGRKGFVPRLTEFNDGAFSAEMGITSPSVPNEETVGGQPIPAGVDPVPEPEINQEVLDQTNEFVRLLGAPTPLKGTAETKRGGEVFASVGCVKCHIAKLRTGYSPIAALNHKVFPAYTDLLLHDMGPDLADICLGEATPSEFRTEPLMGLRVHEHFLHDGRAASLEEAIQMHGGEAAGIRDRFLQLPEGDRAALVAFLKTL